MVDAKIVSFLSTLVFIAGILVAYSAALQQRTVIVYNCVYSYETKGQYSNMRYYARGVECNPGAENLTCRGDLSIQGSYLATEKDIEKAENNGIGSFYDGFSFNFTPKN